MYPVPTERDIFSSPEPTAESDAIIRPAGRIDIEAIDHDMAGGAQFKTAYHGQTDALHHDRSIVFTLFMTDDDHVVKNMEFIKELTIQP